MKLTLTIESLADLDPAILTLAALRDQHRAAQPPDTVRNEDTAEGVDVKPRKPRAPKPAPAQTEAEPPALGTSTPEAAPTQPAAGTTYDDVRNATQALIAAKGRDAALAVFKALGVESALKLTPEQWPGALDALVAAREA